MKCPLWLISASTDLSFKSLYFDPDSEDGVLNCTSISPHKQTTQAVSWPIPPTQPPTTELPSCSHIEGQGEVVWTARKHVLEEQPTYVKAAPGERVSSLEGLREGGYTHYRQQGAGQSLEATSCECCKLNRDRPWSDAWSTLAAEGAGSVGPHEVGQVPGVGKSSEIAVVYPGHTCYDFLLPVCGFPSHFLNCVFDKQKF